MTNSGMFEDAEKIIYLENQNKLLKKKLREAVKIDKDHQELNGKLQTRLTEVEEDNKRLSEQIQDLTTSRKFGDGTH